MGMIAAMLALLAAAMPATAGPSILFEPESGKVYYSEDADLPWHPASLTKMMTAYVVFEALKEGTITADDKLICSEEALKQPPSKVGLPVGGEMNLGLGVRALIIKSANDVAVMLAEKVSGSVDGFVFRMNQTAHRLGMTGTNFANPNGLPDPKNITTARDMGILARAILRDYPQYASLFGERIVQIGDKKLSSHNALLKSFEGADGMKTGFICDSGYNVVASATRDKLKLIAVVLGEVSAGHRTRRASDMLQHGFDTHLWKESLDTLPTIDTLSKSGDGAAVQSIRSKVLAWACGYRDPNAKPKKKKGKKGKGKDPKGKSKDKGKGKDKKTTEKSGNKPVATDAKVAEPKAAKEAIATEAAAQ